MKEWLRMTKLRSRTATKNLDEEFFEPAEAQEGHYSMSASAIDVSKTSSTNGHRTSPVSQRFPSRDEVVGPNEGLDIDRPVPIGRAICVTILSGWLIYFIIKTGTDFLIDGVFLERLPGWGLLSLVGAVLSFLLYLWVQRIWNEGVSLHKVSATTILATGVAAALFALLSWFASNIFEHDAPVSVTGILLEWSVAVPYFIVQAAAFFAILFAREMKWNEHKAVATERIAMDAALRARKYQLNPHFLFKSLNSSLALISGGRVSEAERTIEAIIDFYEQSLAIESAELVPLDQEVKAQRRYLEIERARFSERLDFEFSVPEDLGEVIVPAMVMQPLIENCVRHGVSASPEPVFINLDAREEDGQLVILLTNIFRERRVRPRRRGSGRGIDTVRERLRTTFGDQATLVTGPIPNGFLAELRLPASRQAPFV
jgi:Putative regulator of cell autolysis